MQIGILPDPRASADWPQIEAYLKPAAELGNVPILEANEAVWVVREGLLLAAATARLTEDGYGEIILCGGRFHRRWAQALADRICEWMEEEEMTSVRITGRGGWLRALRGWHEIGREGRIIALERVL